MLCALDFDPGIQSRILRLDLAEDVPRGKRMVIFHVLRLRTDRDEGTQVVIYVEGCVIEMENDMVVGVECQIGNSGEFRSSIGVRPQVVCICVRTVD